MNQFPLALTRWMMSSRTGHVSVSRFSFLEETKKKREEKSNYATQNGGFGHETMQMEWIKLIRRKKKKVPPSWPRRGQERLVFFVLFFAVLFARKFPKKINRPGRGKQPFTFSCRFVILEKNSKLAIWCYSFLFLREQASATRKIRGREFVKSTLRRRKRKFCSRSRSTRRVRAGRFQDGGHFRFPPRRRHVAVAEPHRMQRKKNVHA